jgi:hypothetical protein
MPRDTRDILELLRAHVLRGEQEMMGLSDADREIVYRALLWLAATEIERLRALVAELGGRET